MSISERELEDLLFSSPRKVKVSWGGCVTGWLARQYVVPSGRIDLLGYMTSEHGRALAVVEVKKGRINSSALAQVCRYASDITRIIEEITGTVGPLSIHDTQVFKIVVGSHINERDHIAAEGMDVHPCVYSLKDGALWTTQPFTSISTDRFIACEQLSHDSPFEYWMKQAQLELNSLFPHLRDNWGDNE